MTTGDFMKYVYPAILTPDKEFDDWYSIKFPDLEGCTTETSGGLYWALFNAAEFLNKFLTNLEDTGAEIPKPTDIKNIKAEENEIVTLIKANTDAHRLLKAKFETM